MRDTLFGVRPGNLLTMASVPGILALTALLALAGLPARRASRLEPAQTL